MTGTTRLAQLSGHIGARSLSSTAKLSSSTPDQSSSSIISTRISEIPGRDGKVGIITISNARKLNLVNSEILVQLREAFEALSSTPDLRAAVLTGGTIPEKAPAFIGGADIKEMAALKNPEEARSFILKIHDVSDAIRNFPVPVIARVHGYALGAGLELMAICDLKVATEGSTFGMPEVKVGIPSVVEACLLPNLIGWGRTRRFVLLAENITADVAQKWGLVEEVCKSVEDLDRTVDDWVDKIAQNGPEAMKSQKRLIKKWESCSVEEAIEAGVQAFADSYADGGKEPKMLMGKFLNKTK